MFDCEKCGSRELKRISGGVRCSKCGTIVQDKKQVMFITHDRMEVVQKERELDAMLSFDTDLYENQFGR